MVSFRPLSRVVGPLPNGLNGLQMGVPNHLLTGMILQVKDCLDSSRFFVGTDLMVTGGISPYSKGTLLNDFPTKKTLEN